MGMRVTPPKNIFYMTDFPPDTDWPEGGGPLPWASFSATNEHWRYRLRRQEIEFNLQHVPMLHELGMITDEDYEAWLLSDQVYIPPVHSALP